ncbi:MAG: hypothetical protein ACUVRD_02380 [Bacteroidia bacterium]
MEKSKLSTEEALRVIVEALNGAKGRWHLDGRPWVSWGLWLTAAAAIHASLVERYPWIGFVAWLGGVAGGLLTLRFLHRSQPRAPYIEAFWRPFSALFGTVMAILGSTFGIYQLYWLLPSLSLLLGGFVTLLAGALSGRPILYVSGGMSLIFHVVLAWPGWVDDPSTHMWVVALGMLLTIFMPGVWLTLRESK